MIVPDGPITDLMDWEPYLNSWNREASLSIAGSSSRWEIDWDRMADAIDFLGIRDETHISLSDPRYGLPLAVLVVWFEYEGDIEDGAHVISMPSSVPPEVASICLWHELTHAAQEERYDSKSDFWDMSHDIPPYFCREYVEHPIENEAFLNMNMHWEIGSLCRQKVLTDQPTTITLKA